MTRPIEDRVRDLMADRTAEVVPPAGWGERIVTAGRRRRVRRRAGAIAGIAVAVLLVVAAVANVPQALLGVQPVGPLDRLPAGASTDHTYASGTAEGATLVAGDNRWGAEGFVQDLQRAEDGVVALVMRDNVQVVYYRAGGSAKVLQTVGSVTRIAVSPDGKRVAWMDSREAPGFGYLRLAELPGGRIVASKVVEPGAAPKQGTPFVTAFLGDRVVLTYDSAQSPYAWDPDTNRVEPLLGTSYAGKQGRFLDADRPSDTVLLFDGKGCVSNVSATGSRPAQRWKTCGFDPQRATEARISPDGSWFAMYQLEGDTVWVRNLENGKQVWKSDVVPGQRLTQLEWESAGSLLAMYGTAGDLDAEVGDLVRCRAERPDCERVPVGDGDRVTRLGR